MEFPRSPLPAPQIRVSRCVIFLAVLLCFLHPGVLSASESRVFSLQLVKVIDSTGRRLTSAFDNLLPNPRARVELHTALGNSVCKPVGVEASAIAWKGVDFSYSAPTYAQKTNCTTCGTSYVICESRRCGQFLRCGYFFCYNAGTDPCAGYYSCDVCGGACTGDFECDSCTP